MDEKIKGFRTARSPWTDPECKVAETIKVVVRIKKYKHRTESTPYQQAVFRDRDINSQICVFAPGQKYVWNLLVH